MRTFPKSNRWKRRLTSYEKLDSVLDRNAELWDRVDAEYDEKIAANEPDMPLELEEDDLALCEKSR